MPRTWSCRRDPAAERPVASAARPAERAQPLPPLAAGLLGLVPLVFRDWSRLP